MIGYTRDRKSVRPQGHLQSFAGYRHAAGYAGFDKLYADRGDLEIDNNAAERATPPLAVGHKNWLFAGSDTGGERATVIYILIESAKLNGLDPKPISGTF